MESITHLVEFEPTGDLSGLQTAVGRLRQRGAQSLLILLGEGNSIPEDALESFLPSLDVPAFGGVFPRLIQGHKTYRQGSLVCGFAAPILVGNITDIGDPVLDVERRLEMECPWLGSARSVLVLVDGLAQGIDAFTDLLYDQLGPGIPVMGGGSGCLDMVRRPCLFSNAGISRNGALVVALPHELAIGVRHGWQQMAGPLLVTHAEDNTVHTLNFRPAYDVYRESVEELTGKEFPHSEFAHIAMSHPFGLEKLDAEMLVRDPIQVQGQSLVCVGRVEPNSMVYILRGEPEQLVQAAGEAMAGARRAIGRDGQNAYRRALLVDCISRFVFLDGEFVNELAAIEGNAADNVNLLGMFTLGEIASSGSGGIHFLNKSTVVGMLEGC